MLKNAMLALGLVLLAAILAVTSYDTFSDGDVDEAVVVDGAVESAEPSISPVNPLPDVRALEERISELEDQVNELRMGLEEMDADSEPLPWLQDVFGFLQFLMFSGFADGIDYDFSAIESWLEPEPELGPIRATEPGN